MIKLEYYCKDCDEVHTTFIKYASDICEVVCPKCRSHNIFVRNLENDEPNEDITLGRGGCGKQTSW